MGLGIHFISTVTLPISTYQIHQVQSVSELLPTTAGKGRFPLNVSVIATNRSCLLARTPLRFASFHKQPSFGLLRGLLYLEACKSRSASGI